MIEIAIGVVAFGAGLLVSKLRSRRNTPKQPCPWSLCGYPLSETPLVKYRGASKYDVQYEDEPCPGCGQGVSWCRYTESYVRIPTPMK